VDAGSVGRAAWVRLHGSWDMSAAWQLAAPADRPSAGQPRSRCGVACPLHTRQAVETVPRTVLCDALSGPIVACTLHLGQFAADTGGPAEYLAVA